MSIDPIKSGGLANLDIARLKNQALDALLGSTGEASDDIFSALPTQAASLFEQYLGVATASSPFAIDDVPSAADAFGGFALPGMNVMTAINRADVSFKAQFSELSELKNRIAQQADAAKPLAAIDGRVTDVQVLAQLRDFLTVYNAGVMRFAPAVEKGGVLEGSREAERARFAMRRELSNPLVGAQAGLRDGLEALGITVDAGTGLASLDEGKFKSALAGNRDASLQTLKTFAQGVVDTAASLNKDEGPQARQLANLQKAINWIAENRASVEQEFGPGKQARPTPAFAKAAAAYYNFTGKL